MSRKFYNPLSEVLSGLLANVPDGNNLALGANTPRLNQDLSQKDIAGSIANVMRVLEHEACELERKREEAGKLVPKEGAIDWDAQAVQARIVCEHFHEVFFTGTMARTEEGVAPVDDVTVGAIAIKSGRTPLFVRAMMWLPPDLVDCRAGSFRKEFWAETAAKF